ncbi:unnamed protein product [Heligmosomoides polygyrus]|uniref:Transmembrane protein n=1 Tax=Heligmosomoides polygyrus TaxID=6339 RepID=A0A183FL85_HELPZ|nr:unnamed protein product [Heligmosomoides polygyrus]
MFSRSATNDGGQEAPEPVDQSSLVPFEAMRLLMMAVVVVAAVVFVVGGLVSFRVTTTRRVAPSPIRNLHCNQGRQLMRLLTSMHEPFGAAVI